VRTVQIGDSAVLLELRILEEGLPTIGEIPTVAIRKLSNHHFLDWTDGTFKASGWTEKNAAMTEVIGVDELAGVYRKTWDPTAVIVDQGDYEAVYSWEEGEEIYRDAEVLHFTRSNLAEQVATNRIRIDTATSTLKLYAADGTTVLKSWPLTDKAGGPVTLDDLPLGLVANRGTPS